MGHALLTEVPALELLAKLVAAALRIICQNKLSALPAVIQLRHLTVEDWSSDTAAAAEQLEEYQRSNSFKPLLTASDLKVTALLLRLHAADLQQSASAPGSAPAGANRRHEGLAAARQLQALMPDNPAVLLLRAALLSEAPNEAAAAAAAYGKALSAAQANQAHSVVATAGEEQFGMPRGAGRWVLSDMLLLNVPAGSRPHSRWRRGGAT